MMSIGLRMVSRALADELVEIYLKHFEGPIRILHIPTFKKAYHDYWQNPNDASQDFVVQLQLCLALGAVLYDETFTLRNLATAWVYETQYWLMLPPEKGKMTLITIQIMCLLVLAKEACSVGSDLTWTMMGALVRKATYMGLHRDPKYLADMTVYKAEVRRRLWATILELNLQTSYDAGGTTFITEMDYDTLPPANLDDEQLIDERSANETKEQPMDAYTQTSVQLALMKSLPLRSKILNYVNALRAQDNYDEILQLNSELIAACRQYTQTMLSFLGPNAGALSEKNFVAAIGQILLCRCFHALHQGVVTRSIKDPRYMYSRKMYLDGSIMILHAHGLLGSPRFKVYPAGKSLPRSPSVHRLSVNGAGMFRNIVVQSMFAVAVELLHQKEEQSSGLGFTTTVRDLDLLEPLEGALSWIRDRGRSGETSVKGHCFVSARVSHSIALGQGLATQEIEAAILNAATLAAKEGWDMLNEMAIRDGLSMEDNGELMMPDMDTMTDLLMDWTAWGESFAIFGLPGAMDDMGYVPSQLEATM